jgi:uncharacterized protein YidB (DUF937 family)
MRLWDTAIMHAASLRLIPSWKMGTQAPPTTRRKLNRQPPSQAIERLVQRVERGGLGDVIGSWIGSGPNQPIGTDQLHQAIGPETIERLPQKTDIGKGELLPLVAQILPSIVDRLTPNQRVPDESEISRNQSNPSIEI